jgi:hypothetical protein
MPGDQLALDRGGTPRETFVGRIAGRTCLSTGSRQPTLFAKAVLVAAAVGAICGLVEVMRGLFSLDFAEVGHGVFIVAVAIGATWLFNNFGGAKPN